ncbi:hypothetical protein EW146_g6483 [Bondarzewia mesenterica]|uniref:Uncharacterized protein n=1 Tax=Bondarzewia mesenterica TaxID=1095465 RepID=A0A4S4LQG8_9AGAM|nr:hypothetical protein EW146_g6483 [Bondarzewia mesenterica]
MWRINTRDDEEGTRARASMKIRVPLNSSTSKRARVDVNKKAKPVEYLDKRHMLILIVWIYARWPRPDRSARGEAKRWLFELRVGETIVDQDQGTDEVGSGDQYSMSMG